MEIKRASYQDRLKKREKQISLWLSRVLLILTLLGGAPRSRFVRERLDLALNTIADGITELILRLAVLRLSRAKAPEKGMRGYVEPRATQADFTRRAAIGCQLRRIVRCANAPADFRTRVKNLRAVLLYKEELIARLTRRLSKGLTRQGFAHTRAPLVKASGAPAQAGARGGVDCDGFWGALSRMISALRADTS